MRRRPLVFIIIIVFYLASCNILHKEMDTTLVLPTMVIKSPTSTPKLEDTALPTETFTPIPTPTPTQIPIDTQTLKILDEESIPINDPLLLAEKLLGIGVVPSTIEPRMLEYKIGDEEMFWGSNNQDEPFEINAALQYITETAYYWVDKTAQFSQNDLEKLALTFENKIIPSNHSFFGSEWSPGIDGDPRIYILFARGLGTNIAGYFSSADEIHPLAHEYSNAHEMFVLNIDNVDLADDFTSGVLAHEMQHMIHWNLDRNETTWLNEGFSELSQFINEFPQGSEDIEYAKDPDLQLNTWSHDDDENGRHYGASFLFVAYLLDRLGEVVTKDIVQNPINGLASIDDITHQMNIIDMERERILTADDLVLDWAIANFIGNEDLRDGRFGYSNYLAHPRTEQSDIIRQCDGTKNDYTVHQYGVDYVRILCPGEINLQFSGPVTTTVIPIEPITGDYFYWSNKGDSSDMILTREFDFTNSPSVLTLRYKTWYNIEEGWDYVYLVTSNDAVNWQILQPSHSTDNNPVGNNYGWGYTGNSNGGTWIEEEVDISHLAGELAYLRFEYITDASLHGEGFALDDISIPEIGYSSSFEEEKSSWIGDGFVRINNTLPQTYLLALMRIGELVTVDYLPLGPNNSLSMDLDIADTDVIILTVIGATRYTRSLANYSISISQR